MTGVSSAADLRPEPPGTSTDLSAVPDMRKGQSRFPPGRKGQSRIHPRWSPPSFEEAEREATFFAGPVVVVAAVGRPIEVSLNPAVEWSRRARRPFGHFPVFDPGLTNLNQPTFSGNKCRA